MDYFNSTAEFFTRNYNLLLTGDWLTVVTTVSALFTVLLLTGLIAELLSRMIIGWRAVTTAPIFISAYLGYLAYNETGSDKVIEQATLIIIIYLTVLICTFPFLQILRNLNTLKWSMIMHPDSAKTAFFGRAISCNKVWLFIYPLTSPIICAMFLKFILYVPKNAKTKQKNAQQKEVYKDDERYVDLFGFPALAASAPALDPTNFWSYHTDIDEDNL